MPLRIKNVLAFFILSSLLLVSVFSPLLINKDDFVFSGERKAGIPAALKFLEGNICCPEDRSETFLRGELHFVPNLGTSIFTTAAVRWSLIPVIIGYYFYPDILQFDHNPVNIAVFNHLGDGMK